MHQTLFHHQTRGTHGLSFWLFYEMMQVKLVLPLLFNGLELPAANLGIDRASSNIPKSPRFFLYHAASLLRQELSIPFSERVSWFARLTPVQVCAELLFSSALLHSL